MVHPHTSIKGNNNPSIPQIPHSLPLPRQHPLGQCSNFLGAGIEGEGEEEEALGATISALAEGLTEVTTSRALSGTRLNRPAGVASRKLTMRRRERPILRAPRRTTHQKGSPILSVRRRTSRLRTAASRPRQRCHLQTEPLLQVLRLRAPPRRSSVSHLRRLRNLLQRRPSPKYPRSSTRSPRNETHPNNGTASSRSSGNLTNADQTTALMIVAISRIARMTVDTTTAAAAMIVTMTAGHATDDPIADMTADMTVGTTAALKVVTINGTKTTASVISKTEAYRKARLLSLPLREVDRTPGLRRQQGRSPPPPLGRKPGRSRRR